MDARMSQTSPMPLTSRANDHKRASHPDNLTDEMKQQLTAEQLRILRKYFKDCTDEEKQERKRLINKISVDRHYAGVSRKQIHKPKVPRNPAANAPSAHTQVPSAPSQAPSAPNQAPSAFRLVVRQGAPLHIQAVQHLPPLNTQAPQQLAAVRAPVTVVYPQ